MTTTAPPANRPPQTSARVNTKAHALRAVIAQELQQNMLTIALLLGIAAVIATIATYYQYQFHDGYSSYHTDINILFLPVTQMAVTIGIAAVGFLLGCLQTKRENTPELWAFLIHRPNHRALLFLGRLLAGTLLYLVVAGIPLAVLLCYSATHAGGEFFNWRFTLPSLADFFSGYVYYLAGLLIAQSNAILVGPRVFPLIPAFLCSFLTQAVDSFTSAVLIAAAFAAVLIVAALGSFQSNGFRLKTPPLQQCARFLLIWLGITALASIPFAYSLKILYYEKLADFSNEHYFYAHQPARTISTRIFLLEGTLVTRVFHTPPIDFYIDGANHVIKVTTTYTTLDGTALPNLTPKIAEPDNGQKGPSDYSLSASTVQDQFAYRELNYFVDDFDVFHNNTDDKIGDREKWFYLKPVRRFYIYKSKPRAFLGTFGQNGFVPPGQLAQPFARPMDARGPFAEPNGLFQIDFDQRKLVTLFTPPAGEILTQYMPLNDDFSALATNKRIYLEGKYIKNSTESYPLIDHSFQPFASLPFDHPLKDFHVRLYWFPTGKLWALWYTPIKTTTSSSFVDLFDSTGKLLRETKLDWEHRVEPPFSDTLSPKEITILQQGEYVTGLLDGAFSPVLTQILPRIPQVARNAIPQAVYFATLLISALLCTALAFFVLRRYCVSNRRAIPWLVATLLLGLPAILTFLATHTYPRRLKCPACHKSRPIAKNLCPRCNSPWPSPPTTGTEIFGVAMPQNL